MRSFPPRAATSGKGSNLRAAVASPSVCDFYFTPHRFSALGAKVLSDLLSKKNINVSLYSFPFFTKRGHVLSLTHELSHLKIFINPEETGKLSFFTKFQRFGPAADECAKAIISSSPDICFISCFAFSYAMESLDLARALKAIKPQLSIVLGGAGPSAYPGYFIRDASVDFVIVNEAEVSIPLFVDAFFHHRVPYERVPNLFWKKNNQPHSPSIKRFTSAEDISIVITNTRETSDETFFSTSLSRGCEKRCAFCSNFLSHGPGYRTAAIDKIKDALAGIKPDSTPATKKRFVNFEDDNLLCNKEYLFEVMELFKSSFQNTSFLFENGVDYALLTPELTDRLIDAETCKFNLSLVSASQAIAKKENRFLAIDHYERIVRSIASRNIPCITYFICGLENDTKESVVDTLSFLLFQPTAIGISLFYAVPGIQNFKDLHQFDKIPPSLCMGSSAYPWNASLSTETLITAFRLSRFCNLVKQEKKTALENAVILKMRETKKLFTFVKKLSGIEIAQVEHYDEKLAEMFFKRIEEIESGGSTKTA
jgi:hypothetical protein